MQIGVPYIFAVSRARRAAAGIARLTDSKNRLSAADGLVFLMVCVQPVQVCPQNYRKPSRRRLGLYNRSKFDQLLRNRRTTSARNSWAKVVFPAPFGPAMMMQRGG